MKRPLRKIVGNRYDSARDKVYDVLECGHIMPEANGIYGRENRTKRRCRKCEEAGSTDLVAGHISVLRKATALLGRTEEFCNSCDALLTSGSGPCPKCGTEEPR